MKFNSLIPELSVSDIKRSISFYVNYLGFKIKYQRAEAGFVFLSLGNIQIMIEQNNNNWKTGELSYPYGRGVNFQIEVDDISNIFNRLKNNDYPIFIEPEEHWYRIDKEYCGFKEFLVLDPDGYLLRFSQELGFRGEISLDT